MPDLCPICENSGLEIVLRPDGSRAARTCSCRLQRRLARNLAACRIPALYEHCSFESFDTTFPGATQSLRAALLHARHFVESFPLETEGKGLLFTGDIGTGKTNLAISTLRALVQERGATGLFVHYGDLLKQIQNSYNPSVASTELAILQPLFDCDVLVIDELGAVRPSPWVLDTIGILINRRYNDRKTTLVTTNYPNEPEAAQNTYAGLSDARVATARESLGDRIGERMRSRLQEMCVVVPMQGVDFRRTVNLARFG